MLEVAQVADPEARAQSRDVAIVPPLLPVTVTLTSCAGSAVAANRGGRLAGCRSGGGQVSGRQNGGND
ncbi:hypothetical protein [Salipiger thiooxidans]|uniref:hypothetical protein n=1 Tax=Salipiger thiooxidans TaxID=282683 RepID=UPI00104282FF|nr:hypothetical protein [Salipiger thiooxidans]